MAAKTTGITRVWQWLTRPWQWLTRPWQWLKRWLAGRSIGVATVLVVLGGLAIVCGAVLVLFKLIYGDWGLKTPETETDRAALVELVRVALTLAVGVGGAVALVVAYRKQKRAEEDNEPKHARFGNAAAQLGAEQAAMRLAGVYAMANLADEWPAQRQQCVDVLCAYLRLPWNPNPDPDHLLAARTIAQIPADEESGAGTTTTYAYPAQGGEVEVRKTILRLIAAHLQDDDRRAQGTPSWSDLPLDFTGATLPDLDFRNAHIGTGTSFTRAHFAGDARFDGAQFTGYAWFGGAQFTGPAWFDGARFTGPAWFDGAQFTGPAKFDGAQFTGDAWFSGAQFTGYAWFDGARFTGDAWFFGAQFTGDARFIGARFTGDARFSGAWFDGAQFTGDAWFSGARFTGDARFSGAQFTGDARFDRVTPVEKLAFKDAHFARPPVFESPGAGGVPEDAIYLDEPDTWPPEFKGEGRSS